MGRHLRRGRQRWLLLLLLLLTSGSAHAKHTAGHVGLPSIRRGLLRLGLHRRRVLLVLLLWMLLLLLQWKRRLRGL
jgi:hypothetical protein